MDLLINLAIFLFYIVLIVGAIALAALAIKKLRSQDENNQNHFYSYQKKQNKLLQKLLKIAGRKAPKSSKQKLSSVLYVIDFEGDVYAKNVDFLEQQVDAIISSSKPNDQVLVKVNTPGGIVFSYGFAASQILRLKNHGLNVVCSVDKVAASGGYLMSTIAHKIIAAPFAIVGSIGVVAQVPNFRKLLESYNINIEEHTAGKYKRTISPLGEITKEGREKFKESLEKIHTNFKSLVLEHRPNIDIDQVATGEHWLANDALKLKLVDEIKTSGEYLMEVSDKFNIVIMPNKSTKSITKKLFAFIENQISSLYSA